MAHPFPSTMSQCQECGWGTRMQASTLLEALGGCKRATTQQQCCFLLICAKRNTKSAVSLNPHAASCHLPLNTRSGDSPLADVRRSEKFSASCEVMTGLWPGRNVLESRILGGSVEMLVQWDLPGVLLACGTFQHWCLVWVVSLRSSFIKIQDVWFKGSALYSARCKSVVLDKKFDLTERVKSCFFPQV